MSKGLETLKHIRRSFKNLGIKGIPTKYQKECLDTIEKELKALEIIKAIGIIKVYETVNKYKLETLVDEINLTKENYELLKEVLL